MNVEWNLPRIVFGVLFLGGLIAASFWVLRPFLGATIWAAMVVVATWPLMLRVQRLLWGKRSLAVIVMTLLLLLVFFVPVLLAVSQVVENADTIAGWPKEIATMTIPPPPAWLGSVPIVGAKLQAVWQEFATKGPAELAARIAPFQATVTRWFLEQLGGATVRVVEFLLTVIVAAILFASGESAAAELERFARRLAGAHGENAVHLAAQAVRSVALGVVVTALIQAALAGAGLAVAGVPFAAVLTGIMLLLCIAQIGPLPILLIGIGWLYWKGEIGWMVALIVWSVLVGRIDPILLPILIKRGAGSSVPLLLIFVGVIGGLVGFGLIGLFIGPMVLAVSYSLLQAWVASGTDTTSPSSQGAGEPGGALARSSTATRLESGETMRQPASMPQPRGADPSIP